MVKRASAYLATVDPAIEGQGGSKPTFRAACQLVGKFKLSRAQAIQLIETEYSPRCKPRWSRDEIEHKVDDAIEETKGEAPIEDRPLKKAKRVHSDAAPSNDFEHSDSDAPDAPPAFETVGMDAEAAKLPLLKILGPAEIFAPLPPLEYLVEQLVVRGTALQILAYGSSGKSWLGFHMAVACAAGAAFLGRFPTKQCRALYLDFENGTREARRRIQANTKARGIASAGLALGLCSMPSMYLDDPRFIGEIRRLASEYDLFIVDTLRAATRGEENASEARKPIDDIKAVIEETKGALVVLSHTKKVSQSVTKIDPREAGRGSSAIFDAFDAVLHLAYEEGQPLLATQTKGRSGRFVEPFGITIVDTENGGVDVVAGDAPDVEKESPSGAFAAKCDAAVAFLKSQPVGSTGRALRDATKCNGVTMGRVTDFLVRNGIIEDRSTRPGSPVWYYRGSVGQ